MFSGVFFVAAFFAVRVFDLKTADTSTVGAGQNDSEQPSEPVAARATISDNESAKSLVAETTREPATRTSPDHRNLTVAEAEFAQIQQQLVDDPHEESRLNRLRSLAVVHPELRPKIIAFVTELYGAGGGNAALAETLGDLYRTDANPAAAAEMYRAAKNWTDRPFRVLSSLQMAEIEAGEFEHAISSGKEQSALIGEYMLGKRDKTLIKDVVHDSHLVVPCILSAVAYAKLDDIESGQKTLRDCGKGVLSEKDLTGFRRDMEKFNLAEMRNLTLAEILD